MAVASPNKSFASGAALNPLQVRRNLLDFPESVTARHYLDLTDLRRLHPEVQQFGDWVEEKGMIARGGNVVVLKRKEIPFE
ncbi:hypothetical protein [Rhodophyticola porphyridii]|uniref:hypothetical protein n=1 Tax=Rhodophyticola porphyridii TaxID=1852017 RepID=UPI0035CEC06A